MTREKILKEILKIPSHNIILELPTGFGKTRLSIEKVKSLNIKTLLIVVNRVVHKTVWQEEIDKWWKNNSINITMTTYVSLHKYAGNYDAIIWDEVHHFTERCAEIVNTGYSSKYNIFLTATLPKEAKEILCNTFSNIYTYKKTLRNAIDSAILPDPKVFLIPLQLNNSLYTEEIVKNPKKGNPVTVFYNNRFTVSAIKNRKIVIKCTPFQYISELDRQIEWFKEKYMRTRNDVFKFKWLKLCGDRLKFLSDQKIPYTQEILKLLDNYRTITFCNNIEQTKILGKYCINSKEEHSMEYYNMFNDKQINHITACNMLNESANLVDCKVGIYNNLNSSDVIIKQRQGRTLRHNKPVIIIPYFKGTREAELIKKMSENYNPSLITTIFNINDLMNSDEFSN